MPYYSCWRDFNVGRKFRIKKMVETCSQFMSEEEIIRAKVDLAVVSALLNVDAGTHWKFEEEGEKKKIFSFRRISCSEFLDVSKRRFFF